MTLLIIRRLLESVILSVAILVACSVILHGYPGFALYFTFGMVVASVQCVRQFTLFRTENRWWLYSIVLIWDSLFWPSTILTSVKKAYINNA